MYKTRIKEWKLDKNKKEREMKAAVRKYGQRANQRKASAWQIRGRHTDYQEMARYFARKHISIMDVMTQQKRSPTPEEVVCLTPLRSPISIPTKLAVPELMLLQTRNYINGSFDSGNWVKTEPYAPSYSTKRIREQATPPPETAFAQYRDAVHLLHQIAWLQAKPAGDVFISSIRHLLLLEDPFILNEIFSLIISLYHSDKTGSSSDVIQSVTDIGKEVLGESHPIPYIASCLTVLNGCNIAETVAKCLQALTNCFEANLGAMHSTTIGLRATQYSVTSENLTKLLQECCRELGAGDPRTIYVRVRLADELSNGDKLDLAIRECDDIIRRAHDVEPKEISLYYRAQNLFYLARCQRKSSLPHIAIPNLREAVSLLISGYCSWDCEARGWLDILQGWLTEVGQHDEAAVVQYWWDLMKKAELESRL